MQEKKTPLRMCIVCREMKDKKELMRIVRDKDERFFLDSTMKANGRGAYLCDNQICVERCLKKRVLNKAFKTQVSDEVYQMIGEAYAKKQSTD